MEVAPVTEPYVPTDGDRASVEAWFREYDALAAKVDIEKLADLAVFPLNVVSDDSSGDAAAAQWTREQYMETMAQVDGVADLGTFHTLGQPNMNIHVDRARAAPRSGRCVGPRRPATFMAERVPQRRRAWHLRS